MGKGLTITAFICSFPLPPIGLILGIIALMRAKYDQNSLKGLAITSIIIGGLQTLLIIYIILFNPFLS